MSEANGSDSASRKRPLSADEDESSSSDEDVGPALPSASLQPKKKSRKLAHESLYVAALPLGSRYSKSLMHKDQLSFVTITPHTDFLITSSIDGQVTFWKKSTDIGDVEFVKEFMAHDGEIVSVSVSWDGASFASAGKDGTVKVWDITSFDLVASLTIPKIPASVCWVHARGGGIPMLAVGNQTDGEISLWDGRGGASEPLHVVSKLHRRPVTTMAYNSKWDCVVSGDDGGMVEYWQPQGGYDKPEAVFKIKSSTDLFAFKKSKSVPSSIAFSPSGNHFATFSFPDRKVRIFDFASGKLHRTYDESIETIQEMQQAGTSVATLEDVEFGRRLAAEKELSSAFYHNRANVLFDETGHFIMYGSLHGIKVLNTITNRVVKVYGKEEHFRPLNLALYQGQPRKKDITTIEMAASDNPLLREAEARDAILASTAVGKVRFYMFTNEIEVSKTSRDVHNEKPRTLNPAKGKAQEEQKRATGNSATLHTTLGDIQIRLYPEAAPKTVENFVTHARSGYYNDVIFHRVIRKFMIQTGDPLGDGTGGESIWGGEFEDEFSSLKHDKAYTISMANAGPNTNASQFFITTEKTPWLDGKHTVFGRGIQGLDVVHKIENAKVHKEKPVEDIKIVSITIT